MTFDSQANAKNAPPPEGQGAHARQPLAIVGIGCRFPKADSVDAYWSNIRRGVDAIADVPPTHWRPEEYFDNDKNAPDMTYARRGGFLDPIDFDPLEFGIAPNNLEATDTTQLLGMLAARDALRDAGYETGTGVGDGRSFDRDRCCVIMGVTGTLELVIPLGARLGHPIWRRALKEAGVDDATADDVVQRIADGYVPWQENSFPGLLGNVAAGRIANRFDLGGSNCVVDAACASSLSAIHMAAMELWSGKADMAITGGLDTFNDIFMYMCFSKTPALSPSGNAKPFAADGDGTILGEGLGVLILKRLDDAERDGDHIYALIRGIGSSSDGRGNAIYAPSAKGQTKALRNAYRDAAVTPDTIELIEAHGTGTKVGDATEVRALKEVYGEAATSPPLTSDIRHSTSHIPSRPWCAIGSVKSMVGHTKAAAGAAGLIKAAMALNKRVLPPTIKVDAPLAEFNDPQSPVYVNATARPWVSSDDHPRRAAVSAFGFGGSNFHCVLEEPPDKAHGVQGDERVDFDGRVIVAPFSGDSVDALARALDHLDPAADWATLREDAAEWRASFDRSHRCRLVLVIERERTDLAQLVTRARRMLESQPEAPCWTTPDGAYFAQGNVAGGLAVLFPGQGSQRVGMLRDLACQFPHVIDALDTANRAFSQHRSDDARRLSDCIYPIASYTDGARKADEVALRDTRVAQPALGAVSAGAWRALQHFGVTPNAAAGHSFGELVALWAAGRIDEESLHRLANARAQAMAAVAGASDDKAADQRVDRGAMLAVAAPIDRVESILAGEATDIVVANHNAPEQVVLSGPTAQIDRIASVLTARGLRNKRLPVAAAFHSSLVAAAERPFAQALANVTMAPGSIDVYANTTGECYPPDGEAARRLLAGQLARPVRFVRQIQTMYAAGVRTFIEVGPGRTLTGLVDAILAEHEHHAIAIDPTSDDSGRGQYNLACALARLAALGHSVDLTKWDPRPPKRDRQSKPRMTVRLSGANYVSPRNPRQPRRSAESAAATPSTPIATASSAAPVKQERVPASSCKQTDAQPTAPQASRPAPQPPARPAPPAPSSVAASHTRPQPVSTRPDQSAHVPASPPNAGAPIVGATGASAGASGGASGGAFTEALRVTQQSVLALQRMQEQNAALHRQYLESQQVAHQTVRELIEQQQRLISASLGMAAAPPAAPAIAPPQVTAPVVLPAPQIASTPAATVDPLPIEVPTPQRTPVARPQPIVAAPAPMPQAAAPVARDEPRPAVVSASTSHIEHRTSNIHHVLLEVVAEKTGYPAEMLDLDMSLDADLGIDSIKRVEILSALQERMPGAPHVKPEDLGVLQTLRQIVTYIEGAAGDSIVAAPATPSPTTAQAPAPASPTAYPTSNIQQVLLEVVAEKTGYPVEMLDLDMSLDADLGIDSIKRVEILSALQERMPDAPAVKPEDLGALSSLRQIVTFIGGAEASSSETTVAPVDASPVTVKAGSIAPAATATPLEHAVFLQRLTVAPETIAPAATRPPIRLSRGATVWITDDGGELASALQSSLAARGFDAVIVSADHAPDPAIDRPAGLVVLSPQSTDSDAADARFVATAFDLIQRLGPSLREAAGHGGALLAAATRLDGALGIDANHAIASPVTGALAGIVKTAAIEWPGVACKVVDIGHNGAATVDRLVAELLHEGPIELALGAAVTQTLSLSEQPSPDREAAPLGPDDVVVITGGARGVTAAAAVAIARAWRPRVLLLGRSAEPTPEPDWLIPLRDEARIKQAILAHHGQGRMTPRAVDDAFRQHMANREARRTIAAIEAAGARVLYQSVNVRDAEAVAAAIDVARQTLGPIRVIVHGAGVLADRLIEDKTPEQFDAVFGTKVDGLLNLLAATRDDALSAIALFSSSTARFGRKGQVDYAAANEALNKLAQREARRRTSCRVVSVNWGPWDGGMVTPALKRVFESEGVNVIPIDAGAELLVHELSAPVGSPVEIVVLGAGSTVVEGQGPRAKGHGAEAHSDSTTTVPTTTNQLSSSTAAPAPPALGPWPSALSIAFEREITIERYPFLRSHVLNGRPVLPVAVMIEWLAHGALHDNPGMAFVGFDDLRVFKGVVLDPTDAAPTKVRVLAAQPTSRDGVDHVAVELRSGDTLHARAWIALGYTHTPVTLSDAPLPREPYARGVADMYEDGRLFHGPDMHALRAVVACDGAGIVGGAVAAPPVSEWFRQPMRSTWLADPLAIDAAFQMVILWTQQERGQGSLPTAVGSYRQHQRAFPRDGVRVIARITKQSDHSAEADVEFVDASGRPVATMRRYECVIDDSLNDAFARNRLPMEVGS